MSASERQVAGTHYSSSLQHWDFITDHCGFSAEYYIGCATKYLTRHRKKNGRQDLEKSMHFIEKLIELSKRHTAALQSKRAFPNTSPTLSDLRQYCAANDLAANGDEFAALVMLFSACVTGDYERAAEYVGLILEKEYPVDVPPEKTVGGDTIPVLYNPPMPAPGFVWEGQSGDREFWQCMRCSEHVTAGERVPPASVHRCKPRG